MKIMTDRDVTDQPTQRPTEQPPNQSTDKPKDGREVSQERATLLKKGLGRPDRRSYGQTEERADKVVYEEYFSSKMILISNGYASYMIINKKSTYQDTHYLLDYK